MNFAKEYLCILLLFAVGAIQSQDIEYVIYNTDDGLPSNTVYKIVQDSNGLIWLGTGNGLVSFDGDSFSKYSDSRLKDNDILELEVSKDGHITFGNASNQYCRLEGDDLVIVDVDFDHFFDLRSTTHEDYVIDVNNRENAFYLYQDKLVNIDIGPVIGVRFDSLDRLIPYYSCTYLQDKSVAQYNESCLSYKMERIGHNAHLAGDKYESIQGDCYVREKQVWLVDSLLLSQVDVLAINYITESANNVYVITKEGLVVYDKKSRDVERILEDFILQFGFLDNENILWLSTKNNGVLKVPVHDFEILPHVGLQNLRDIKLAGENLVSFSFSEVAIYNKNNELVKQIPLSSLYDQLLLIDDGAFYVFAISGTRRFDFDGREYFSKSLLISQNYASKSLLPFDDKVFFGGNFYLYYLNKSFLKKGPVFDDYIRVSKILRINVIAGSESNGIIFVGTDKGLFEVNRNDFTPQIVHQRFENQNIKSLFYQDDSTLWVGTSNDGLYSINDKGAIDSIDIEDCIGSKVINDIVQYDKYLFVATPGGLVRLNTITADCSILNSNRGLLTNNITKVLVKSLDSIFITQNKRLVMIENAMFDEPFYQTKILIQNFYSNNSPIQYQENVALKNDQNNIELQFDYYTYRNVASKKLQYKINEDSIWTLSNDMNLRFPSLESNNYRVDVRGFYANTEYTNTLTINFTVLPPWWQTLWARLLGILGLLALVFSIVYVRGKRIERLEAVKRDFLKIQENEKRDYINQINKIKDQALQLQMNPHFIFNAMNAIQNFITSNKEKNATIYLARFAKLIRLIFEYSSTNLIKVEEELEFVKLYLDLEQLRFQDRVVCSFGISKELEEVKDIYRIPPLLIQPIIENSFKHGLFHKLEGGELSVYYDIVDCTLTIVVEDNGIGREARAEMKNLKMNEDRPSGLKNIDERIAMLKYNNPNLENSIQIEDLYSYGKAAGTRTTIKLTINE